MSLSKSERESIILNDARGIQHPFYYVSQSKDGKIYVRKRKVPLANAESDNIKVYGKGEVHEAHVKPSIQTEKSIEPEEKKPDVLSITNQELIAKFVNFIEKQTESKNPDPPVKEVETKENVQFIENVKKQLPPRMPRRRVRIMK
ncbi:hypothetical protein TVAG_164330 [Trichomonas vaginalis G3]|uniref:Uncharacterized protein n=2 Tax=Trichomonas vaginalis (strain ATCC PRA-98 / G3) TaxID=412133 RepID=A2E1X4_TRIV3|nr:hypothetical protein TVAGG3_0327040 [Trichomonas vaginalis G3]XP_051076502.1 uncharacterized protein TVAGG3_1068230 [Trichomonas vaginalis G3]XP_051080846.1 hypothetical protein TVAGG3_1033600 [Trichomonas vaginalis G3]XP_051092807.1 hypothetical protein TVAGG3_0459300 [Trichomonas vaginalis G3]XP_051094152.1 hypothetical protein TVAGG3_0494350 [Trichomonas vaginalis G3]XP_051097801.1 hypothetical protein TVAGG3_0609120 [Trichomonas vaginalis G3]XP_051107769.1 hypothetical protein TVAGG3_0|eukprot:XP_001281582.1 hypothetical protein [Trichomonas vaginalis G3]